MNLNSACYSYSKDPHRRVAKKGLLMKKLLLASAALVLAAPAFAADLPVRSAAPAPYYAPVLASSWTGFYIGLNAGGVAIDYGAPDDMSGYTIGLRAGYDYQFGNGFVVGVMGDADFSTANQKRTPGGLPTIKVENRSIFTANLRAGFTLTPNFLLYATGGYSYFDIKVSDPGLFFARPLPGSADGYNVGIGAEYRWTPNLSVFAEYRYHDLQLSGRGNGGAEVNQAKVGLNYRFASPVGPVMARY